MRTQVEIAGMGLAIEKDAKPCSPEGPHRESHPDAYSMQCLQLETLLEVRALLEGLPQAIAEALAKQKPVPPFAVHNDGAAIRPFAVPNRRNTYIAEAPGGIGLRQSPDGQWAWSKTAYSVIDGAKAAEEALRQAPDWRLGPVVDQ